MVTKHFKVVTNNHIFNDNLVRQAVANQLAVLPLPEVLRCLENGEIQKSTLADNDSGELIQERCLSSY